MNLLKSWDLEIDPGVFKSLNKLSQQDAEAEENSWRRRVGNYRIFYKIYIATKVILVFRIERRTSSTY